jgi:arabinan endo-1,5-alpha-L-arabinosidase
MKRVIACAVLLASAISVARAQVTMSDSVEYKIKNVNSGLVLGISGASQTAGAAALQWADNGTADHLWHFIPMGSGEYNIENMNSHQVLGISGASTSSGAAALQWADNSTSDHLWEVIASGSFFKIKNINSGLYLTVQGASTSDTAIIDQEASSSSTSQEWTFVNTGTDPFNMPIAVSGTGIFVHDPMMVKESGVYWLYGTHNTLATSTNRTSWTADGVGLSPIPSWVASYSSTNDIWAPDVVFTSSQYRQYYAVSTFGTNTSAIGLATATSPKSTAWADKGIVISTSSSSTDNAIDPAPVEDASGNWWLSFGSFFDGIHLIELNASTGLKSTSNTTVYHLAERANGIEGSFIYFFNGFYYLFTSIDTCCNGVNSTYRIAVGRSSTINGTYTDRGGVSMLSGGGTIVLSAHDNIDGPGGQSILADTDGLILVYHYYDGNNNGTPTLGMNLLSWTSDGWPYVP